MSSEIPVAPGFGGLPPSTRAKLELLWRQAEEKGANCVGQQAKFIDYSEDQPPSESKARELCFGCPVFNLCKQVAEETEASYGVWAGRVYDG